MNFLVKSISLASTTLLLSGSLPPSVIASPLSPQLKTAQATNNQSVQALQLFQQGNQLVESQKLPAALMKYQQALEIYTSIGDEQGKSLTSQKLESTLVAANALATQQETKIKQELADFIKRFPKTENNDTANKLEDLGAKLGFNLRGASDSRQLPISETSKQAFAQINKELNLYINLQLEYSNTKINEPPEKLRRYLNTNADTLAAIRTLVLQDEPIRWGTDITQIYDKNFSDAVPSYLELVNLQKILALDTLEKSRLGKTSEMLENLEASWKLSQSLRNDPILISQLVSIIETRLQAGIIRKLDNFPSTWQQRLLEHDYRKSILTSLEPELFSSFAYFSQIPPDKIKESYYLEEIKTLNWDKWSEPLRKTYLRWLAIDYLQNQKKVLRKIPQENVCSFDNDTFLKQFPSKNIFEQKADYNAFGAWNNQWLKGGRLMLELELTQRLLQVKKLQTKQGNFPQSIPNLDSAICPGRSWVTKVSPDGGTMSISLNQMPESLSRLRGLPLIYLIFNTPFTF